MKNAKTMATTRIKKEKITHIFKNNNNIMIIIKLYKGQYDKLMLSVLLFIIKLSPAWVLPIISSNIVNAAINPNDTAIKTIIINIIIIVVLLLQNMISNYFYTYLYSKMTRNLEYELRISLICCLQELSMSYHNEMQAGRLQSKIMRDVEQIQNLTSEIFISLLSIILNMIVALTVVFHSSNSVFLFFLFTIPMAVLVYYIFRKNVKKHNRKYRENMENITSSVAEMISLILTTKAHAVEKTEIEKMDLKLGKIRSNGFQLDMTQSLFGSINWVSFQLFQVLCLGYTGWLALKGEILPGDIVMYQTYFSILVNQVGSLVSLFPNIAKGLESIDSIGEIIKNNENEIESKSGKMLLSILDGKIEFLNVGFQYRNAVYPVIDNLNFSIEQGETVAFVGRTGVGKTTILNLIIGFYKTSTGKILIDGKDINSIDLSSYRSQISVVPQIPVLFTGTIKENILYGIENVDDEFLNKVIEASNLIEFLKSLPEGLDTLITGNGTNLSGGQKQRISIARALVRKPKILILDEATSSLDTISEKKIQKGLKEFMQGYTTIIVAHRLSTIKNADKIIVVGNAGILEMGTYEELLAAKGDFFDFCSV